MKIDLNVKGMVCEGCESRLKNALSLIDGVEEVKASFKENKVIVTLSKEIDENILREKINDLGFDVE